MTEAWEVDSLARWCRRTVTYRPTETLWWGWGRSGGGTVRRAYQDREWSVDGGVTWWPAVCGNWTTMGVWDDAVGD